MPRPLQASATAYPAHDVACMGDSYTFNVTLGVRPDQFWPHWLQTRLRAAGYAVTCRNWGVSGNRSDQMVARAPVMTSRGQPKVCIIFAGANDPAGGVTAVQTTANVRSMVKFVKNGAAAVVASQASLPATYTVPGSTLVVPITAGTRYIVTSDTSTTGGLAAVGYTPATVTGTPGGVQCWINRTPIAGEAGWSRVADLSLTDKFILMTPMFLNLASGTVDTAQPGGSHSGQNATSLAIHNAIVAAVTAEAAQDGGQTIVYDTYDFEQKRVLAGIDPAGSWTTHIASNNEHPSPYGGYVRAEGLYAAMSAAGWLNSLLPVGAVG